MLEATFFFLFLAIYEVIWSHIKPMPPEMGDGDWLDDFYSYGEGA